MENQQILASRVESLNCKSGARVGDYIKLPYGLITRITHIWPDKAQTGGASGSYYLASDGCSYSGGLDSGVLISDLVPTDETKEGRIWFFNKNQARAHNGVDFIIPFRVFELRDGANTSGCPEVAAHEKAQFLKTVETITRINGNDQPYTLPVPEVRILDHEKIADKIKLAESLTGLVFTFRDWTNSAFVQPMKVSQFETIKEVFKGLTQDFFNNSTHPNTFFINMKPRY